MKIKPFVAEIPIAIAKACIGQTPVGSVVAEIWDGFQKYQADRKIKRLEEFMYSIMDTVHSLTDSLNEEYLRKEDFLDVFETTINKVVCERSDEKREMYRNILCNSISAQNCSYDKTEKYMRILENLDSIEIQILALLRNPKRFNELRGNVIKDPNEGSYMNYSRTYFIMDQFIALLGYDGEDIIDAIETLIRHRLVISDTAQIRLQTNGHPIDIFNNILTEKGKDFVKYCEK